MRVSTDTAMNGMQEAGDTDTPGGRLWRARGALNLSIEDLARHLGVAVQTVSDWERDRSAPDGPELAALATLLGMPASWLSRGVLPSAPGASPSLLALLSELEAVKALHARTGEALQALEVSLRRVLQET